MYRRSLLKLAGFGAAAALLPARLSAAAAHRWANWSGNQHASPNAIHYPTDTTQLADLLRGSTGTVRCFGGSHSFSALVPTNETLISLEAFNGLRQHHSDKNTATFGAGTRLGGASAQAWAVGQSFVNEPDINLQSLAGAIATSTHGTGRDLPSLSGLVESLTLMTAQGDLLSLNQSDGDMFRAAICSLGALGAVTEITFKNQPRYFLKEKTRVMPLKDAFQLVDRDKDKHRNIEMFAFPQGGTAIVKTMDIIDDDALIFPEDNSNDLLEMACETTMHANWLVAPIQKLLQYLIKEEIKQGPAHRVYANVRTVRFNEMEYTVDADQGLAVLENLCEEINRRDIDVMFPLEFRYCAADNSLIGMFSERPGASISLHQYYKEDAQPYFSAAEPLLQKAGGRPHWGKIHTMNAEQLSGIYPGFEKFQAIRQQLDPQKRFMNTHLQKILGVGSFS
ncbi:MAG: D-arabinono-1,4-lactone oxidase [Alcanivoracaceae bacterium]|nr:D-arabinono-1,4-lactone oxidase [Alcanivoracaceae bacterium]